MARPLRTPSADKASRSAWPWAAWGAVLGAVLATVLFAPAAWVAQAAWAATDGRLILRDSQGSVWHGSAELGLTGGAGSSDAARLPGRLQWDLRPSWNGLRIHLHAECCTPQGQQLVWAPGLQGWRLQVLPGTSTWPAALLTGLGTPWNTVQLQGSLLLGTSGLTLTSAIDRLQVDGSLSLDMPDLASSLSTLRPLGSYRLLVQGGEQPSVDLRTVKGSLQLQGMGQWTAGRLRFVGEARADAAHEAELSNLLNIMGQRDGARSVITLG